MVLLLEILLLYVFGVFLYTIVVKNNVMHKFSPFTNVVEIAKEGAIGLAIGLSIFIALLFVANQIWIYIVV